MKNNRGFTLTEILLAVMIVGLIGVSLAAVTTAALRESSIGRTRLVLRDHLSRAMIQLRRDIHLATSAEVDDGKLILRYDAGRYIGPGNLPASVVYQFIPGSISAPEGNDVKIGGNIIRTDGSGSQVWLDNVKHIPGTAYSSTGSFSMMGTGTEQGQDSRIQVKIIVQANSFPVVNEVINETFVTPNGSGSME